MKASETYDLTGEVYESLRDVARGSASADAEIMHAYTEGVEYCKRYGLSLPPAAIVRLVELSESHAAATRLPLSSVMANTMNAFVGRAA